MEAMPDTETIRDDLDWVSDKLSSRVWSVSLGVLGTCIAFIIESAKGSGSPPFISPDRAIWPILFSLAALLFDFLQYIFAYVMGRRALEASEANPASSTTYAKDSLLRKCRFFAFNLKLVSCLLGVIVLIYFSLEKAIG